MLEATQKSCGAAASLTAGRPEIQLSESPPLCCYRHEGEGCLIQPSRLVTRNGFCPAHRSSAACKAEVTAGVRLRSPGNPPLGAVLRGTPGVRLLPSALCLLLKAASLEHKPGLSCQPSGTGSGCKSQLAQLALLCAACAELGGVVCARPAAADKPPLCARQTLTALFLVCSLSETLSVLV